MLNLEPRNEIRVQTPEEDNKILFLNEDGDLVLKDDAGDIKYVTISDVKPPKVYKALLTQTETDAPTAIVLENTLGGEVVWTRTNVGEYRGTLDGAFAEDKVFAPGIVLSRESNDERFLSIYVNIDYLSVSVYDNTVTNIDNFFNVPISIEVYS